MREQRERAQADSRAKKLGHADVSAYRDGPGRRRRHHLHRVRRGASARRASLGLLVGGTGVPAAREGDEVELVLDRTPFYAEGGGQLADQGVIRLRDGAEVEVHDVQTPDAGRRSCTAARSPAARSPSTTPAIGEVDVRAGAARSAARTPPPTWCTRRSARRSARPRPRPARRTRRAGSGSTSPRRRRCPPSVMTDVEQEVNEVLAADLDVRAEVMTQDQARAAGAMALFGEKYGDEVRVVSVGDWARELCGGTHAQRSGQLGLVKILGESSIGAGVRRVEALVGADAYQFLAREHALVAQLTDALKVRPEELPERVAGAHQPAPRGREGPREDPLPAGAGRRGRAGRGPGRRLRRRRRDPPRAGRHQRRRPAPAGARRPRPDPRRAAGGGGDGLGRRTAGRWSSSR